MDVSIIGGTGSEGFGLALRLARAGNHVTIGSRSEERGGAAAQEARRLLGDGNVDGTTNREAAAAGVVIVTVPFEGQAEIYRSIKDRVPSGAVVVDCTSPLATAVGGRAWHVVRPWQGSAAEQAKAILDPSARIVGAFHTIPGESLQDLDHDLESDVLVCGSDKEAKAVVGSLIDQIPKLRWVDVGDLTQARITETLTALLISINRGYKIRDAAIRITGRDAWGAPG